MDPFPDAGIDHLLRDLSPVGVPARYTRVRRAPDPDRGGRVRPHERGQDLLRGAGVAAVSTRVFGVPRGGEVRRPARVRIDAAVTDRGYRSPEGGLELGVVDRELCVG